MSKRKRPDTAGPAKPFLTEGEKTILDVIKKSTDIGIWTRDVKYRTNLPDKIVAAALKKLLTIHLIKEVVTVQNKARKHYMAVEFEPSKEITGGAWYVDGSLDTKTIADLKEMCCMIIRKLKVATVEMIYESSRSLTQEVYGVEQIEQVMASLVLDNEVVQVKSTGLGEYASVPSGKVCYKCKGKDGRGSGGALGSVPCGVCPRISVCTPDGVVSPLTCSYFTRWLEF